MGFNSGFKGLIFQFKRGKGVTEGCEINSSKYFPNLSSLISKRIKFLSERSNLNYGLNAGSSFKLLI